MLESQRLNRRLTALSLAAVLSLGCGGHPKPEIELANDSRLAAADFRIDGPEAPRIITFERLSGPAARTGTEVWQLLRRSDASVRAPVQLRYGIVPDGYRAMRAADSLGVATYRIYAKLTHAGGELYFSVGADGRLHEGRSAR